MSQGHDKNSYADKVDRIMVGGLFRARFCYLLWSLCIYTGVAIVTPELGDVFSISLPAADVIDRYFAEVR